MGSIKNHNIYKYNEVVYVRMMIRPLGLQNHSDKFTNSIWCAGITCFSLCLFFSTDGKITTLVSLDYEIKSVYNLTVIAMDLGTPSLNSTFDLTIMVQDVYDTAPQFAHSLYERAIDVNTPTSTVILGVTAGRYIKEYKIEGMQLFTL